MNDALWVSNGFSSMFLSISKMGVDHKIRTEDRIAHLFCCYDMEACSQSLDSDLSRSLRMPSINFIQHVQTALH